MITVPAPFVDSSRREYLRRVAAVVVELRHLDSIGVSLDMVPTAIRCGQAARIVDGAQR